MTVAILPHDLAVVAALGTITGSHPVGLGAAPDGALDALLAGTGPDYIIVYPLNGSTRDGTLGAPYIDADLSYQFTVVGASAEGVRWLADRIEAALASLSISGRTVMYVDPVDAGAVRRETDVRPDYVGVGLFVATPRYSIATTPN